MTMTAILRAAFGTDAGLRQIDTVQVQRAIDRMGSEADSLNAMFPEQPSTTIAEAIVVLAREAPRA